MTTNEGSTGRPKLGVAVFLALQAVLVLAVWGWASVRAGQLENGRALPEFLPEPLEIVPLYDDPEVISDKQLSRVLSRLGLVSRGTETSMGHIDHALRFWGPKIAFEAEAVFSGDDLRGLVTDHSRFIELYGPRQPSLLIDDGQGVTVRVQEGVATASHFDHTLASLAEVGTPLDYPVQTRGRQTEVRAILARSLEDFSLNQAEYEWSSLAYALYLAPGQGWMSREGQFLTFDRLAGRIMREHLPNGVCSGNHRLYALTAFLRVDDLRREAGQDLLLSVAMRDEVLAYLAAATANFVRHQHPDGFWNRDWPLAVPAGSEPSGLEGDDMSDRLIATGHVLEWWALAPEEVHPPRSVVVDAAQWLVRTVDSLSAEEIQSYYSYLSHAGRALALWRGRFPDEVELQAGHER